jgi:probable phosphoglycerate mutase
MRLVIIRHGDPDYSIDSLTETGWKEAHLLAEKMAKMDVQEFYVSPLGRAKDTASCTLKKMGREAVELDWLQEFRPTVLRPDAGGKRKVSWDWLPQDWTADDRFYSYEHWHEHEVFQEAHVKEEYDRVAEKFDAFLADHGYRREGRIYRVERENEDTIVLFCHFALGCVLLSRLFSVSPMILWHHLCSAPTGVTIVNTEERRQGIAAFRMSTYGDVSHLYAGGQEPAFAARFCETFGNESQRHD